MASSPVDPGGGYVYKDRDPPPAWGGERPESSLKPYLKDLQLWEAVTDVPANKRGPKLVQVLTGAAREAVRHLEVETLTKEDGLKQVVKALVDAFQPYQETALPRAMEAALYGPNCAHREPISDFLVRFTQSQRALRDEGVELPSKAQGYLLYRQANLDKDLEARLLTWLAGDYSLDAVTANLRRLDRAMNEGHKRGTTFYEDGGHTDDDDQDRYPDEHDAYYQDYAYDQEPAHEEQNEETYYQQPALEDVFDEVVEEDDLLDVLASYKDVRESMRQSRNGRGFYPKGKGNSFGPLPSSSSHKGAGKSKQDARPLSIQEIKLRTRCRTCGQIGHWSRECRQARQGTTASSSTPSASSRTSFFWTSDQKGPKVSFFASSTDGARAADEHDKTEKSDAKEEQVPFVGVVTRGFQGIVDTAAQEGLVGKEALLRLFDELRKYGLKGHWNGKTTEARGIGGKANTLGTVEVPVGIGGVPGILELTVVSEDVPLLVPVNMLRALGALIDLGEGRLHLRAVETTCDLSFLASGHPVVNLTDFGNGWFLPEVCREHRDEGMFRAETRSFPNKSVMSDQRSLGSTALLAASGGGLAHAREPRARTSAPASSRGRHAMAADTASSPRRPRKAQLAGLGRQALLCAAVGALARGGLSVDSFTGSCPRPVPVGGRTFNDLYPYETGGHGQGRGLQEVPYRAEAGSASRGKKERGADPARAVPAPAEGGGNGMFTGRTLEAAEPIEDPPKLAKTVQDASRAAMEKDHLHQQEELLKIISQQRLQLEEAQAQLDMTTGNFLEYDRFVPKEPPDVLVMPTEIENPEATEQKGILEEVFGPAARAPSKAEKDAIDKLHRSLGHPSNRELSRALSVSRAAPHLIKYAKEDFKCPSCEAHRMPKWNRPTTMPKSYAPNTVIGVDLMQVPNHDGTQTIWLLNMVCWGTSFQLVERVRSKEPREVWAAFMRSWGRLLGYPSVVILDQGTEFLSEFRDRAAQLGMVVHQIGARAPHQQGRTERHGAIFKRLLEKARWELPPSEHSDWVLLLRETEATKNRMYHRSGFSPAQRMFGHLPRAVGELCSDEAIDPTLLDHGADLHKLLSARRAAQKAFAEVNTDSAVKVALRSKGRTQRRFEPGEVVFVWRSWKSQGVLKPGWVGPAVVLMPEGPNAYVNVQGRIWKTST